jgi:hypothetical protein
MQIQSFLLRVARVATHDLHLYSLLQRSGPHVNQRDLNNRHNYMYKDRQIIFQIYYYNRIGTYACTGECLVGLNLLPCHRL